MPIRIFISHKLEDAPQARKIAERLRDFHGIDSYLDVLDPVINRTGEELAKYVRDRMSTCTQLLVVISPTTKESWWVPWEIGVASEKDYPLATYGGTASFPDFLKKWPVLRNEFELDAYARASKETDRNRVLLESRSVTASVARRTATQEFYRALRSSLAQ